LLGLKEFGLILNELVRIRENIF